jgi:hypothetical protein
MERDRGGRDQVQVRGYVLRVGVTLIKQAEGVVMEHIFNQVERKTFNFGQFIFYLFLLDM